MASPRSNGEVSRPPALGRHTSPSVMSVNGHFAPVSGESPTREQYEHGIQVIDEDKEFK